MKSIGNDIVALRCINEERTHLPSFYSKFITAGEQQLYTAVIPFTHFVWLLWAVKESAYKYLKRSEADLIFSPINILIQNIAIADDVCNGALVIQGQTLYFVGSIHPEYITAIVNDEPVFEHIFWATEQINSTDSATQSLEVRRLALEKLKAIFPKAELSIEKTGTGYPVIIRNGLTTDVPLSFAHHGNYITYAFRTD